MARSPLSITLLLITWLLSEPALAHLPELYGREYLRVDPENFEPPRSRDRQRILTPPSEAEEQYQQQVRDLEVNAGAYSQGLADPLTNLSQAQLQRGDPEEAAASLRRALYLVRVNEGLYSQSQMPLLRQLMQLYRDHGEYPALGEVYSYYYRVSGVGEPPFSEAGMAAALEYLDWERQLFATRDDQDHRAHLLRAYHANKRMLEEAEHEPLAVYMPLALSQLRNLYLILGDRELQLAMGDAPRVEREISSLQRTAYAKGRRLLDDCLQRAAKAPPRQRAELYLELGDWQHWNGHFIRAQQQYARVIELMEVAGEQAQLAHWFDEPVELPNKTGLWTLIHEENGETPLVVEASYEVNRRGDARRVEATTGTEEGEWQARRIRAMLRDTHFRPRIGPDGPEPGPRVTRHYRLIEIN